MGFGAFKADPAQQISEGLLSRGQGVVFQQQRDLDVGVSDNRER